MIFRTFQLLSVLLASASAFQNSSPFFLFSTSRLSLPQSPHTNIAPAQDIQKQVLEVLTTCPSETYVFVSQPGVSVTDYAHHDSAPHLRRWVHEEKGAGDKRVQSRMVMPQVVGALDEDVILQTLREKCGASVVDLDASAGYVNVGNTSPSVLRVKFAPLPPSREERAARLRENDSFLHAVISAFEAPNYTVILATTSLADVDSAAGTAALFGHGGSYEAEEHFADTAHVELKRDFGSHDVVGRRGENDSSSAADADLGLFEKYQFFTPAIFMGLLVFLILLSISYIGIGAISGLEVSYGAFNKEGGPQAQKKQQQQ